MKFGRRSLVIAGAAVGAALALFLTLNVEPYCIGGGEGGFDATFICYYKSFLGWDVAPLYADTLWTLVGAVVGALIGFTIGRVRSGR